MVMGVMSPKELLGPSGPKGWPLEVVKGEPNYPKNPSFFTIECQRVPKVLHGRKKKENEGKFSSVIQQDFIRRLTDIKR